MEPCRAIHPGGHSFGGGDQRQQHRSSTCQKWQDVDVTVGQMATFSRLCVDEYAFKSLCLATELAIKCASRFPRINCKQVDCKVDTRIPIILCGLDVASTHRPFLPHVCPPRFALCVGAMSLTVLAIRYITHLLHHKTSRPPRFTCHG